MDITTTDAAGVAPPTAISALAEAGPSERGNRSLTQLGLPAHVISTLGAEGVHDLTDWHALGRRRHRLFGIVPATVRLLDAAAREAAP